MINKESKNVSRLKRHERIRKNVSGTPELPRLNVYRSNSHIFAQVIDDVNKVTLVSSSTMMLKSKKASSIEGAVEVGKDIAKKCKDKKIKKVTFDRGGFLYHGRVEALANAAREAGLEF